MSRMTLRVRDQNQVGNVNNNKEVIRGLKRPADVKDALPVQVSRICLHETPVPDVDAESRSDPFSCADYVHEIMLYLRSKELQYQPSDYASTSLAQKTRATTVDWLVEICQMFELTHETLYSAVNILDRYYSKIRSQDKKRMQLIAVCSVLLASKFEECSPPLLEDLRYICKENFTVAQIKKTEMEILGAINFELAAPLSYSFLRRFGKTIKADMQLLTTARFCLEESLHFLKFCRVSPSRMAIASLLWALRVTKKGDWSNILEKYSGYRLDEVEPLVQSLNHMVVRFPVIHPDLSAVKNKYEHEAFLKVADQRPLFDPLPIRSPVQPPESLTRREHFPYIWS